MSVAVSTASTATALLLLACGPTGKPTGPAASGPTTTTTTTTTRTATLAEVGLEATSLDRRVAPCDDFYRFACGGWLTAHPIPADRARYGRVAELGERTEAQLRAILDEAAAGTSDDPTMLALGDYYASCNDQAAIDARGTDGIKPLLAAIGSVTDGKTLLAALTLLHAHRIWAGWSLSLDADLDDATTSMITIDSGGLGLPDRAYYLEARFAPKLTAYRAHLTRLFGLLGKAATAAAMADDVIALETELARVTKSGVERRLVRGMYHPTDLAGLARDAAGVDWAGYFAALGNARPGKLGVTTPVYLAALPGLLARLKPTAWRAYLTARVLDATAIGLPRPFDDEQFTLTQAVTGVAEQPARWKRCVAAVAAAVPELLGQPFVARHVGPDARARAQALVTALTAAMDHQFGTLAWMTPATRDAARAKLARITSMIGYPEAWRTYDFEIVREQFAANQLAAARFEGQRQLARGGTPFDRREWPIAPFAVNARYLAAANTTTLAAGILQPPFFAADRSVPANLGGLGVVIGHELIHGFDDQGAQYDADGTYHRWWQPADQQQFDARARCLTRQYSTFEVLPGTFVDGELTLGENLADLGGIKHAFLAYRALRASAPERITADGFTEDQQFFLGVGQIFCGQDRDDEAARRLTLDLHAPSRWRVDGALRNLPAFAEAFGCTPGQPMAPTDRCEVW